MDDISKLKRTLGQALLEHRRQAGLSQEEVSTQVGIPREVYGRIEQGLMLPSVPTLHRLCQKLNLSAGVLLGLDAEPPAPVDPPGVDADDPPELVRLATLLRVLTPGELRSLVALSAVIARGSRDDEPPEQ